MTIEIGITGFGGYVPKRRLSRASIFEANGWFNPALRSLAKGERAMANWDEDSVTMGVEAGRDCLQGSKEIDSLYFASTSCTYADRLNAAVVARALNLNQEMRALDITSSQRAGTSALISALQDLNHYQANQNLVVAGEKRKSKAGSVQEMRFGDGAAAFKVGAGNDTESGSEPILANFLGSISTTSDFVDHFRSSSDEFDYTWEERWVRDEGFIKQVPPVLKALLQKAEISPNDIDHFILPCPFPRTASKIAKASGIDPQAVSDDLELVLGDTGAAHPLVLLAHTLEHAKPGQKIVLAVFSGGVDALIFETTAALSKAIFPCGISGSLKNSIQEKNYMRWLAFNDLVIQDKGMRAEKDHKAALTVQWRKQDMLSGLVGGRCSKCETVQFPKTLKCVNPECDGNDTQESWSFAEEKGEILSWSADHLTYTPDPPHHYGMVNFAGGGRFMTDFTDVVSGSIDSGTPMKMVFRIKNKDQLRGSTQYFWKATPIS